MSARRPLSFTTAQAAVELQVSPETVRRWIEKGMLPAVKAGRGWRIGRAGLERFLEAGRLEAS